MCIGFQVLIILLNDLLRLLILYLEVHFIYERPKLVYPFMVYLKKRWFVFIKVNETHFRFFSLTRVLKML